MALADGRRYLKGVTIEQWFGLVLLAGLGALLLDLARRIVLGELRFGTFSLFFWRGLIDGLIIALAAAGLSMTYAILKFANFSHGDLVTTGAFTGWTAAYVVGGVGVAEFRTRILLNADRGTSARELDMHLFGAPLAIGIGLLVAAVGTILVALAIDRLVYKRMRNAGGIPLLIASIGVALVLRYLIVFVYGEQTRGVTRSSPTIEHDLVFWTDSLPVHQFVLVVIGVVLMIALHILLQHTKLGTSMRAMADNRDLALVTGIPTERVILMTWIVGAGLTGVAGYLVVLEQGTLSFNTGWFLLLLIFSAVILGGIGSVYGAIAGGLIIGLATNVSLVWIPGDLTNVAAFTLMILILIFRPSGIFGGVETA
ncbi:branched-chain amino acid ABC transporter permease [Halosolutus halophilus]|uniref:branched-chain amino acid ABC transporter permease n=1 Tax=Halosolutus halophilus TaxID=1552990 RepID=UPI0022350BAA|nr:branched-chain amino acid ABC transporter permease [Halosolutus halophilus]